MTVRETIEQLRQYPDDYLVRDADGTEVSWTRCDDAYEEVILEID